MNVVLIGATGLVGNHLLKSLLGHPTVQKVRVFGRSSVGLEHPKLIETIVDFEDFSSWRDLIQGELLISALGTTLKAVGSQKAQYRVDHDYQLMVAEAAVKHGMKSMVLVSSINANASSIFFYLRMKGELENKIKKLPFMSLSIIRPGPLKGKRAIKRPKEEISTKILDYLPKFLLTKSMIPVRGEEVAKVCLQAGLGHFPGVQIITV